MGAGSSVAGTPISTSRESLESRRGSHPPVSSTSSRRSTSNDRETTSSAHRSSSHHKQPSRRKPSHPLPLSEEQKEKVKDCLSTLESTLEEFGVQFNVERIIPKVLVTTQGGNEEEEENDEMEGESGGIFGIFVVDEGSLEVFSQDGKTTLYRLLPGDFFGELSTLFKVQSSTKVNFVDRVTLLQLPASVIRENMRGGESLGRGAMMKWCIKRSIFDSTGVFDSGSISQKILVSCFKSSLLSQISTEAIEFIASLATPVLFSEGDTLYNVGDDPCYIYFILRGQLERYTESEELMEPMRYVKSSDEGFSIGGKQFFRGEKLPHMIKAVGPVLAVPIGREIFLEMANKHTGEVPKLKDLMENYRSSDS